MKNEMAGSSQLLHMCMCTCSWCTSTAHDIDDPDLFHHQRAEHPNDDDFDDISTELITCLIMFICHRRIQAYLVGLPPCQLGDQQRLLPAYDVIAETVLSGTPLLLAIRIRQLHVVARRSRRVSEGHLPAMR